MNVARLTALACSTSVVGCLAGAEPPVVDRAVSAITLPDCSEASIRGFAPPDAAPMLDRAFDWIHRAVPYCQCTSGAVGGYRTDCSGFVSVAWGLPPPGRTTYAVAGGEVAGVFQFHPMWSWIVAAEPDLLD